MTEEKLRGLLPIGSVVLIKTLPRALMIYGILHRDLDSGKVYDYISVFWPQGNGGQGTQLMFNHEDIVTVLFKGLNLIERDRFIDNLVELNKAGGIDA